MAMTKKLTAAWKAIGWMQDPALKAANDERVAHREEFVASGKTAQQGDMVIDPAVDGGLFISYWADQASADEWKAWLSSFAAKYSLPAPTVTIEDIPAGTVIEGAPVVV